MSLDNPCYVIEEDKLRANLQLISSIAKRAEVDIILALKAFANWKVFPIIREYVEHTTASSLYEARLSAEQFGGLTHTYSPAYEEDTFGEILRYSEHITFNSLSQLHRFLPMVQEFEQTSSGHKVSLGLRINPEYSEIGTDLYNPCAPGSRFGVTGKMMESASVSDSDIPFEGLHFHCLCENNSTSLAAVLKHVEQKFGNLLGKIKWLNMGGGHLMTREGYDLELLVSTIRGLHERYPNLRIIMEPGSAFLWQTGFLTARVVDIVCNSGIKTAILNVSFTCHMPDCLEMPYWPTVRGAETLEITDDNPLVRESNVYRLGGNSCLSGDYMGYWRFEKPLNIGDEIILEDMIHYTTVKTNMFNGVHHPSIALQHSDGNLEILKRFSYEDYKNRMD
ncbi:MAG: carboxynorspermidine decarboxylase [Bacteroidaceae bacterium]|nr:carboxynorspermidine decarboxylase [Bacteroidaceae bacterium]